MEKEGLKAEMGTARHEPRAETTGIEMEEREGKGDRHRDRLKRNSQMMKDEGAETTRVKNDGDLTQVRGVILNPE